jgi:pantoate--beta-alanine ligase
MTVVHTIDKARQERSRLKKLALVPTMGSLHAGHMSLIEEARRHADHVAVSIFVNPTQFGPREDYSKYPRPIEDDLAKCKDAGVDLVFSPSETEMYPAGGPMITIDMPTLSDVLEGKHRPGHFHGVCQVVAKLFNILTPEHALFGQKDFQQLRIITAMSESLNFPVKIVPCPTIRDKDGLAMSSRNQYLSQDERDRALSISRALMLARGEVRGGVRQTNRLVATMRNILLDPGQLGRIPVSVDYVVAVDPMTLKPVDNVEGPTLLAIAARVGATRLIDNFVVEPE